MSDDRLREQLAQIYGPEIMHDALDTGEARSYLAARKLVDAETEAFAAAIPARAREITAVLSSLLPDGMRLEYRHGNLEAITVASMNYAPQRPDPSGPLRRAAAAWHQEQQAKRDAEELDRREWIADVKTRLGIVCSGDALFDLDADEAEFRRGEELKASVIRAQEQAVRASLAKIDREMIYGPDAIPAEPPESSGPSPSGPLPP